ncbi:MAG: AAA family ATPase [Hyphomicrobiales bacterium]|nr:AAA family ATPase [Hyphomicrobiales bacterium]MDE2018355.1 AAA family ATPase [Hyphomicrobiales bacterium]
MEWSPQQAQALIEVSRWIKARDRQVFRLFGYAGVGKTTLARHLAEGVAGKVAFAAYTGKAALALRARGCEGASTIHSLIYKATETDAETPLFKLVDDGPAARADLIVIDECSMVDEELGRDLLSFGKPVLVLGDPAQLPPIKGGGFFTEAEPDAMLTEIHRQAQDDPIVRLSMLAREGRDLPLGAHGDSRVIRRAEVDAKAALGADQVLAGLNKTRRALNARIRSLKGFTKPTPEAGDKLVCLRNDRKKGLLNGGLWRVEEVRAPRGQFLQFTLKPEEETGRKAARVRVLSQFFEGGEAEIPFARRRESDEFDYGYALTAHKAQGSEWDDVLVFDESYAFRENRARWLYTAVTRAAKRIVVAR